MSAKPSMCRPRVASSSTATASTPLIALPAPNSVPAPHVTPAANAPSAAPTTGSAVSVPRPSGWLLRIGSTVANAKAAATARITDRCGRKHWPSRMSPYRCSVAIAARTTGRATAAPVPSPSRIRRSTIGSSSSCASASVCAGSVDRCPACHHARAPGANRSATRAAAVTTTPSSSTGVRRTAACARKPAIAARSAPPATRNRPIGSDRDGVRPVERVAHRRGLADPPRVVDTGAAADHRHRLGVGQCRNENRRRRGISDAHVAGDQQVRAGVHLLVGDGAARRDRRGHLVLRQRVLDGDVTAAATHLVGADLR